MVYIKVSWGIMGINLGHIPLIALPGQNDMECLVQDAEGVVRCGSSYIWWIKLSKNKCLICNLWII